MKEWKLSAKALLVLASSLQAQHFYGMRDPFFGMTAQEIRAEQDTLLADLEQTGCVTLGFDGSVSVAPELGQLVQICTDCQVYATVDAICAGQIQPRRLLYRRDGACALVEQDGAAVTLQAYDWQQAPACILGEALQTVPEEPAAVLPQPLLQKLPGLEEPAAVAKLQAAGCGEQMSRLLFRGLTRTADYRSIGVVELARRSLQCIALVSGPEGQLQLLADDDYTDQWHVSWQTASALQRAVAALL